jgi:hypothetical protein
MRVPISPLLPLLESTSPMYKFSTHPVLLIYPVEDEGDLGIHFVSPGVSQVRNMDQELNGVEDGQIPG